MKAYHGKIITCDDRDLVGSYLIEKEGKILYVGDELPKAYEDIKVEEVGALLPAFVDTHMHFSSYSWLHDNFLVTDEVTNEEVVESLKEYIKEHPTGYIIASGLSSHNREDSSKILRDRIDMFAPDRAVCLIDFSGASCVVNSVLLAELRNRISTLRGYHEQTGEMDHEAFDAVIEHISRQNNTRKFINSMIKHADDLAEAGIGIAQTAGGIGCSKEQHLEMEKSVAAGLNNGIQLRIACLDEIPEKVAKKGVDRLLISPLDGDISTKSAALFAPYSDDNSNGILTFTDTELISLCKRANRAGLQICLCATGDRACSQAIHAIAAALDDYPRYDHRHMVVHGCMIDPTSLEICARNNIYLSIQAGYIHWEKESVSHLKSILGERIGDLYTIANYLEKGVTITFGSDAPVTDINPIQWIHNVCNNHNAGQSVKVRDALRMATINGAKASFDERTRGTLEIGKVADMVVLDKSPYDVPVDEIKDIKVKKLILSGKPYVRSTGGAMATMLRGMFPQNV